MGGAAERAGWRRLLPLGAAERGHPVLLVDSAVHGACSVRSLGALLDEAAARRNGSAALAASTRKEERSRRSREGTKGAEEELRAMPRRGARAHLGKAAGAAGEADAEAVSGDLSAVLADTDGGMGDGGGGGGGGGAVTWPRPRGGPRRDSRGDEASVVSLAGGAATRRNEHGAAQHAVEVPPFYMYEGSALNHAWLVGCAGFAALRQSVQARIASPKPPRPYSCCGPLRSNLPPPVLLSPMPPSSLPPGLQHRGGRGVQGSAPPPASRVDPRGCEPHLPTDLRVHLAHARPV